jgi:hypothetical protein
MGQYERAPECPGPNRISAETDALPVYLAATGPPNL